MACAFSLVTPLRCRAYLLVLTLLSSFRTIIESFHSLNGHLLHTYPPPQRIPFSTMHHSALFTVLTIFAVISISTAVALNVNSTGKCRSMSSK